MAEKKGWIKGKKPGAAEGEKKPDAGKDAPAKRRGSVLYDRSKEKSRG